MSPAATDRLSLDEIRALADRAGLYSAVLEQRIHRHNAQSVDADLAQHRWLDAVDGREAVGRGLRRDAKGMRSSLYAWTLSASAAAFGAPGLAQIAGVFGAIRAVNPVTDALHRTTYLWWGRASRQERLQEKYEARKSRQEGTTDQRPLRALAQRIDEKARASGRVTTPEQHAKLLKDIETLAGGEDAVATVFAIARTPLPYYEDAAAIDAKSYAQTICTLAALTIEAAEHLEASWAGANPQVRMGVSSPRFAPGIVTPDDVRDALAESDQFTLQDFTWLRLWSGKTLRSLDDAVGKSEFELTKADLPSGEWISHDKWSLA